ncbi:MAG: hypothetical protein JNK43_03250, partial [Ignavibacteria bacterium]|nr:hypothetical protein [Ignavibacteria bacterium]
MYRFRVLSLLFALLSFFLIDEVPAQYTWSRYFGAPLVNDEAFSCIQTIDENFLVSGYTGFSSGPTTLNKYSQSGELIWSRNYDNTWYMGVNAAEDSSGNLYYGHSRGLVKLDPQGNVLWVRMLPDTIYASCLYFSEDRTKLIRFGGDKISFSDTSANSFWTIRLNDSNIDWHVYDLCQVGSFFYIAGTRTLAGSRYGFVRKYDISGNLVWTVQTPQGSALSTLVRNSD